MTVDQAIRNKLRNVVTQCRRLLEEAVVTSLQGKFGIYAHQEGSGCRRATNARMTNLTDEDQWHRKDILDHFEHIRGPLASSRRTPSTNWCGRSPSRT